MFSRGTSCRGKRECTAGPGAVAGITYQGQGQGAPLVLLPLALASSQWDPLLSRLGTRCCTVALGGPELGFLAMLIARPFSRVSKRGAADNGCGAIAVRRAHS